MKFIKGRSIWMILGLLIFGVSNAAAQDKPFDPSTLSPQGKAAYEELIKVEIFAIGPSGFGGLTSGGERSLAVLARENEAEAALRSVITEGTPVSGLYAILGLKTLDCNCLGAEVKRFKAMPVPDPEPERQLKVTDGVRTMTGCFVLWEAKAEVLKRILSGKYIVWGQGV